VKRHDLKRQNNSDTNATIIKRQNNSDTNATMMKKQLNDYDRSISTRVFMIENFNDIAM
jgi:hypothetical protein